MSEESPGVSSLEERLRLAVQERRVFSLEHEPDSGVEAGLVQELLVNPPLSATGVRGRLALIGAEIVDLLDLDGCTIEGMVLFHRCKFRAGISLNGATAGILRFEGSEIGGLSAAGLRADSLDLRETLVPGGVGLQGARISSGLTLSRSVISARQGMDFAVMADRLVVEGNLTATDTKFVGGLGLHSAQVSGTLTLEGCFLIRVEGGTKALQAHGLHVGAAMLAPRIQTDGAILMPGATIKNDLDFSFAVLRTSTGHALDVSNGTIGNDLRFEGTTATAPVRLVGTQVGGSLNAGSATLSAPGNDALVLDQALIGNSLFIREGFTAAGRLRLRGARIGTLAFNLEGWPPDLRVDLTGITFNDLEPADSRHRPSWWRRIRNRHVSDLYAWIGWADRQSDILAPSFFEQLASVWQRKGDETAARSARYELEMRKMANGGVLGRAWGRLLAVMVGHGYLPGRAAAWLVALIGFGWVFYGYHELQPAVKDENLHWDPLLYTLDVLVPLVDLGYEKAFQTAYLTKVVMIGLVLAGWVLVAAFVAGAARILSRR